MKRQVFETTPAPPQAVAVNGGTTSMSSNGVESTLIACAIDSQCPAGQICMNLVSAPGSRCCVLVLPTASLLSFLGIHHAPPHPAA